MSVRPLMHNPNFNGLPTTLLSGLPYPNNPTILGWASSPFSQKSLGMGDQSKKLAFWNALPTDLQQQFLQYQSAKAIPGLDGFTAKALLAPTANGSIYAGAPIYAQGFGVVFTISSTATPGQFGQIGPFFNKIDIAQTIKDNVDKPGFWHALSGSGFLNDLHNKLRSLVKVGLKTVLYPVTAPLTVIPATKPLASKVNTAVVNNPLTSAAVLAAATGATLATAPTATTAATTTAAPTAAPALAPATAAVDTATPVAATTAATTTGSALAPTVTGAGATSLLPSIGKSTSDLIKNLTPVLPLIPGVMPSGSGGPVSPADVTGGGGGAAPAPTSGLQKLALPALLATAAFFLFNS